MKTSTHNELSDREAARTAAQSGAVEGKAKTAVRCRLCGEMIVLESNFRPTAVTCPYCELKFVFDPQQEPLPIRGVRLRYSDVLEAQRCTGTAQYKRHDAHLQPAVQVSPPKANYLAWAGGLTLSFAAALAFFSGWFQRLTR